MNLLRWMGKAAVDLLYPRRAVCAGCGDMIGCERDDLCEDCRAKLAQNWIGPRTPKARLRLDGAAYAHAYAGPAGGVVRNLKYGSAWVLAEAMGADVVRAARQLRIRELDFVTAVPMHPKRLRVRGKNHAELIARKAAGELGAEYREVLARTRDAPQQARLDARERRRNLKGGFAVPADCANLVSGACVLLIDDVCTTGATAQSCAEALRAAGARRVYFAAYAMGGGRDRG